MYIVNCAGTMYHVQCTLYSVQCTLYSVQCKLKQVYSPNDWWYSESCEVSKRCIGSSLTGTTTTCVSMRSILLLVLTSDLHCEVEHRVKTSVVEESRYRFYKIFNEFYFLFHYLHYIVYFYLYIQISIDNSNKL